MLGWIQLLPYTLDMCALEVMLIVAQESEWVISSSRGHQFYSFPAYVFTPRITTYKPRKETSSEVLCVLSV